MDRLVLAVALVCFSVQAEARASDAPSLTMFSQSIENIAKEVGKSVVQITASGFGSSEQSTGSGVILSSEGYIITNAHVIEGARTIAVTLSNSSENFDTPALAKIVGVDHETDLALLKIEKTGLPYLELDDTEEIRQGQIVLAFGSPLGLSNSMTMGIVSAPRRAISDDNPVEYVQTDAPINPGNSGGALVDTHGRLLGINTFILSQSGGNEGIGFAIPAGVVRNVYGQLQSNGRVRRGLIGAAAQSLTDILVEGLGLPSHSGVVICDTTAGGPADRAGLKIGDIVLSMDGVPLRTGRDLQAQVYNTSPGRQVKFEVVRGKSRSIVEVSIEERLEMIDRLTQLARLSESVERLGILGLSMTNDLQSVLPETRIDHGVVVADRAPMSSSQSVGLEAGDIIHALNNSPVTSVVDLRARLAEAEVGAPMVMQVERNGGLQYIGFRME